MSSNNQKDKSIPFISITSFFFSFIFARLWVIITGADKTVYEESVTHVGRNLIIGGLHVHHFFYGITLLCIGGWLALNYRQRSLRRVAALLY